MTRFRVTQPGIWGPVTVHYTDSEGDAIAFAAERPDRRVVDDLAAVVDPASEYAAIQDQRGAGNRGNRVLNRMWPCGICARAISATHMKRHLSAHDRHGTERSATDREWLAFLSATERQSHALDPSARTPNRETT